MIHVTNLAQHLYPGVIMLYISLARFTHTVYSTSGEHQFACHTDTNAINLSLRHTTVCSVPAGALGIVATLSLAGQIASDYYSPRILAWEPLIEPWGAKLQIELNGTGATTVSSNNLTHKGMSNTHAM
jgi:hypothetical protein